MIILSHHHVLQIFVFRVSIVIFIDYQNHVDFCDPLVWTCERELSLGQFRNVPESHSICDTNTYY